MQLHVPELVRENKTCGDLVQILREINDMIALMVLIEPIEVDEMTVDQYNIECAYDGKRIV